MHTSTKAGNKLTAEQRFRQAFERLKLSIPEKLPKGTPVSQNNVAKEAGCDPSALKKSRFPSLIAEIQHYVSSHKGERPESAYQKRLKQRAKARKAKEILADVIQQRDEAQARLADANLLIVDLYAQIADLNRRLEEYLPKAQAHPLQPKL